MTDSDGLPDRSCDTHLHFYDDRYPVAPGALLRPPDASPDDYRAVQRELGLERLVVVQPTTYGLDNRCQLDAMAAFGAQARGVMVVAAETSDEEIRRLTELGVRGARFHMLPGGALGWDALDEVAARIAPFGWHIQLQLNGRELRDRREQLLALPTQIVVDHVGRFMPPVAPDDESFAVLLDLLESGRGWMKLSAPYESSVTGPPTYQDVGRLVDVAVARVPERLLWASNWPHPGQPEPPSAAELASLLTVFLPDPDIRRQVLVDNAAVLYDF